MNFISLCTHYLQQLQHKIWIYFFGLHYFLFAIFWEINLINLNLFYAQAFLDGEMRNITRERKILENKRLDLDACKNRVRKARAMQMQPPVRWKIE